MILLAVESSCDETAVALVQDGRTVLADCIASSVEMHKIYGGVAANSRIRRDLEAACQAEGCTLYLPPLKLCGDNGSMIGSQGYYEYLAGTRAGNDLNAYANRDISLAYHP